MKTEIPRFIDLGKAHPKIKLDIRYATDQNFVSMQVYPSAKAFLVAEVAQDLLRVQESVEQDGFGLLIFDGYRPWSVTKIFWDTLPEDKHIFVADPAKGSVHNRGAAVDLSLYDLKTGQAVQMPSEFDETTERAYFKYDGCTAEQARLRALLRAHMERFNFKGIPHEWWHFNHASAAKYQIMNLTFDEIETYHLL